MTQTQYLIPALNRVANNERLNGYADLLFADWPSTNWNDHMRWIATAPVIEITDWAETFIANEPMGVE